MTALYWLKERFDHPNEEYYKAKDKAGNVYKIMNPAKLKTWEDKEGRIWVRRPKPELIAAASGKKGAKKGEIEWD